MKRRRIDNGMKAATQALELQWLVPAVMTRRLTQMQSLSPWQAAFQWNRWALEKTVAFSLAGAAFAQGCAQAVLTNTLTTEAASAQSGMRVLEHNARTAARMLAPLHRRVKRNAGRKRG